MTIRIDNEEYDVEIIKKKTTKNTYIRVKDDLTIVITTNKYSGDLFIKNVINENILSIKKMINKVKAKIEYNSKFYYLGKEYDIVFINNKDIIFGDTKLFINRSLDIDNFLKKQAEKIFLERLDYWYNNFSKEIPYPSLTIRKMKSRWGVCNVRTKRVTLNLELIKMPLFCLDYVIYHELSHLIYANHSQDFWELVGENCPEYKKVRKYMKE
jgi:predicted metal-dependent hydrolase